MRYVDYSILILGLCASCALIDGLGGDEDPAQQPSNLPNNNNQNVVGICASGFGAVNACGGDLSGTWALQSLCGSSGYVESLQIDLCAAITLVNETYSNVRGSLVISGGNYFQDIETSLLTEFEVDGSCLTTDCATFASTVLQVPNACIDSVAGCSCGISFTITSSSSGTIGVSGGIATLTDGPSVVDYFYCVQGDTMNYRFVDGTGLTGPNLFFVRSSGGS